MIADYGTTGVTTARHPVSLLRATLDRQRATVSTDLTRVRHGSPVRVGGLVIARQRPGTAKGIVFMLLEDEGGTINLIVPPEVYDRDRLVVRTEPLVVAQGRLERHPAGGGQINVVTQKLWALETPDAPPLAPVKDFHPLDLEEITRQQADEASAAHAVLAPTGTDGAPPGDFDGPGDFRAVAPAVTSFAQGRRR
jgi:error-prone DNA polymerase